MGLPSLSISTRLLRWDLSRDMKMKVLDLRHMVIPSFTARPPPIRLQGNMMPISPACNGGVSAATGYCRSTSAPVERGAAIGGLRTTTPIETPEAKRVSSPSLKTPPTPSTGCKVRCLPTKSPLPRSPERCSRAGVCNAPAADTTTLAFTRMRTFFVPAGGCRFLVNRCFTASAPSSGAVAAGMTVTVASTPIARLRQGKPPIFAVQVISAVLSTVSYSTLST
mmetsp:Transcript_11165/g.18282  ORF Transcript_11165/g.18282 Transcript_11165/m.18282 type:complete len:223 (-) Transcript_11165:284-952(-)